MIQNYAIGGMLYPEQWVRGDATITGGNVELDFRSSLDNGGLYQFGCNQKQINRLVDDIQTLGVALEGQTDTPSIDSHHVIVEFVKNHGLLFHGPSDRHDGQIVFVERLADWRLMTGTYAQTSWLARNLHEAVRGETTKQKEAARINLRLNVNIPDAVIKAILPQSLFSWIDMPDDYRIAFLSRLIAKNVSMGLIQHSATALENNARFDTVGNLDGGKPLGFRYCLWTRSLIGIAYAELSRMLAAKLSKALCESCGRPFTAKRQDARFCPRCRSKRTSQRLRDKQKQLDND